MQCSLRFVHGIRDSAEAHDFSSKSVYRENAFRKCILMHFFKHPKPCRFQPQVRFLELLMNTNWSSKYDEVMKLSASFNEIFDKSLMNFSGNLKSFRLLKLGLLIAFSNKYIIVAVGADPVEN